jgi:hypothetical protein
MMNKPNFEQMSCKELAYFIVAHRDTPEETEARRVYIRRMLDKAEKQGVELHQPTP